MNRMLSTAGDILKVKGRQVWSVGPDMMVLDALDVMATQGIGAVVVLKDGKLVGVMSERDYARKVVLKGLASRDTPVRAIMTEKVITVLPTTSVEECIALMTAHRVRHLPVVDQGELTGLVSVGDAVKAIISEQ
jgi:CBS domain-containing protein